MGWLHFLRNCLSAPSRATKSCARHVSRDQIMEKNSGNGIPIEEPSKNIIIHLKDIESFDGNIILNSVEALVDDAFKTCCTISIEDQERKFSENEKQELIKEIERLQNKAKA